MFGGGVFFFSFLFFFLSFPFGEVNVCMSLYAVVTVGFAFERVYDT